jgi:ketosteroid isomerase-like protein
LLDVKLLLSLFICSLVPAVIPPQGPTPQHIADELLAADRAYAAAGAKTDLVTGIAATLAADVAMPAPGGVIWGSPKAIDALKSNPANTGARVEWTPDRVGLSAEGCHVFTAVYMTIHRADGTTSAAKYLAYWEKQPDGWKALAYKRSAAKAAPPAIEVSYLLPKQIVSVKRDAAAIDRDRETLANAERSFSREAQTIGLGTAFKKYGSPEAINLGGPDLVTFVRGNEEIGNLVGEGKDPKTSPVSWAPDKTIIAASGDFGVTIGYIVRNQPGPDGKALPRQPFFTIWRKDPGGAWKYLAE